MLPIIFKSIGLKDPKTITNKK